MAFSTDFFPPVNYTTFLANYTTFLNYPLYSSVLHTTSAFCIRFLLVFLQTATPTFHTNTLYLHAFFSHKYVENRSKTGQKQVKNM